MTGQPDLAAAHDDLRGRAERGGLRGLTHRAVDREAGLPEGSCSAYLRTRQALVLALTEYVAEGLTGDCEHLAGDLATCRLGATRPSRP